MASTTILGTLILFLCSAVVAYQVVRVHEARRRDLDEATRRTRDILADAAVKIRIAPREGLQRYDEAYASAPRRRIVYEDMLQTARFMLKQAGENSAILYNTHDLVKKMIEFGFETEEVRSMYEHLRYSLSRGKEQWTLNLLAPVQATPAIVDGAFVTVYQGSKITAQDMNKRGLWPEMVDVVAPVSSDLLAVDGKVALVTASGWIFALRAADGSIAWQHKIAERAYERTHLAADRERIFVLLGDGSLRALALADGSPRWALPASERADGVLAVGDSVVLVGERFVRVIGAADGKLRWQSSGAGRTTAVATGGGSLVVVSGRAMSLYDPASDRPIWSFELPAPTSAAALCWGDRVFVPMEDGHVAAVALVATRQTPRLLWNLKLETEVGEPHRHDHEHRHDHDHDHEHEHKHPEKEPLKPGTRIAEVCRSPGAIALGKLYLLGQDTLFCIDARTGELEWIYEALGQARTALLVSQGAVIGGYEEPETKVTFLKVINTGRPESTGWFQAGGDAQRSFRAR